jgi:hypothetical protein
MHTRTTLIMSIVSISSLLFMACGLTSLTNVASTGEPAVQTATEEHAPVQATSQPAVASQPQLQPGGLNYPIVSTGQGLCYDEAVEIACPGAGGAFYGQDAQYTGNTPRYQDNGDGTVTDLITGLMWQADPGQKMTYDQAVSGTSSFRLAGYNDWRLPSIKELYSLILFDGTDVSACPGGSCSATPFIDTRYFNFQYGDTEAGERVIDAQFASSTRYVSTTMRGAETIFGVNFADGRIKGYPTDKSFFVLYVRGNPEYGKNSFAENGDGTISDAAIGLTWMQADSGAGMDWEDALAYCENASVAGYDDWRLPDIKELQSIVEYSRSPATSNSAAIDPLFTATGIIDEAGGSDFPFYWSSTTHADSSGRGAFAAYVAFGSALGYMGNAWIDVHGAGAQRSDPKSGDTSQYSQGHGPQGDAVRIENYVRCVRSGEVTLVVQGEGTSARPSMMVQSDGNQQQGSPEGIPDRGEAGAPPQEALEACQDLNQGSACTVNSPRGALSGSCQLVGSGQQACVPAGRPTGGVSPP